MSETLKPCPFDAGTAELKTNELDERYSYGRAAWVECSKCGARTATFYHDDARGYANKETANPKAIAAWNIRAMGPTPGVERVARAIAADQAKRYGIGADEAWESCADCGREQLLADARAAIEAIAGEARSDGTTQIGPAGTASTRAEGIAHD